MSKDPPQAKYETTPYFNEVNRLINNSNKNKPKVSKRTPLATAQTQEEAKFPNSEGGYANHDRGVANVGQAPVLLDLPTERTGIADAKTMLSLLETLQTTVMKKGIDYDIIQGTTKPTLLKPGAELLVRVFNLVPDAHITNRIELLDREIPYFQYDAVCSLSNRYDTYLGNGLGSSNSGEPSFAFKWVFESDLPGELSARKEDLRSMVLNGRNAYRVESSRIDIFGAVNSIQKRAKKRAFVDAVLGITSVSRLFTQDIRAENETDDDKET